MNYVVGSGPAGVSCARALVAAGKQVTLLDTGLRLEPQRQSAVQHLANSEPSSWDAPATAFMREGMSTGKGGIPLKLLFGSDYPYRAVAGSHAIDMEGTETKPSYALGGFSTVWGSACLPYRQQDIQDWPITIGDLAPGYRAALEGMPYSAVQDDLENFFPLHGHATGNLPMSRQATAVLADLNRHRAALNARGVHFGASRLAANAADCALCGLCMYGCPRQLIYSSDQSLPRLSATGLLHYQPGITVQSIQESGSGVVIHALDDQNKAVVFEGERVFLAAGLLNTTTILLRSMQAYDAPVHMRDSQYFLLPILRLRSVGGVARERLHTLAQLFIEVFDEAISPYTVHLQAYTYNDLFLDRIVHALGPLRHLFPMESFLGRLMLLQGYLHSSHSAGLSAVLQRHEDKDVLRLTTEPNPETRHKLRQLAAKLSKLSSKTGFLPLLPLLDLGKPGRGYHSGGSFPMSAQPTAGQTDLLGRPQGMRRVHAVDATVFPSIPATTITLSIMANAYRIGSLAAQPEQESA